MRITAIFKNHEKWVNQSLLKIQPLAIKGLEKAASLVKGRAQTAYLTGPYPEHLRVGKSGTGGALRQNLMFIVRAFGDIPEAILMTSPITKYGAIWEASSPRWKHRKGKMFKNATPMARPFIRPAWEDEEKRANIEFKKILITGLNR